MRAPVIALALVAGCGGAKSAATPDAGDPGAAATRAAATRLYPTLAETYGAPQGIYRGCGPNGGVCHNSREFPDLATMGSLVDLVGRPCNEKRDDPRSLHDLCERRGDSLRLGTATAEIGWLEPVDLEHLRWRVELAADLPPPAPRAPLAIVRPDPGGSAPLVLYDLVGAASAVRDPALPRTVWLTIESPNRAEVKFLQDWFGKAGVPGDPESLQLGDPNRDGIFGATLGGALIAPGAPDRSYLFTRLLDPAAGPLMPRANCCYWTKASLDAVWCWVAGLAADGKNAMDPIRYDRCPPLPRAADDLLYPQPGATCEVSGGCPVQPKMAWPDGAPPTFANVYRYILQPSCGGAGSCHDAAQPGAGLSMRTQDDAYRDLVTGERPRVVPGAPDKSLVVKRTSPELCVAPSCLTMPLGRTPLDKSLRDLIAQWITMGAQP